VSNASGPRDAAKRRIAGYVALAALLFLVSIAWLSSRPGAGSPSTSQAPPAATVPQKGLTEDLPPIAPRGSEVEATLENVVLTPQARLMAERFMCVCGCKDILSTCTCKKTPGSIDMKRYLQELVSGGKTPAEIETAMVARYGEKVLP
jgi:cytochrome c-type biogenesis protein CcmH/NrfF